MINNIKEYWIFIDDSCKLYDKNDFTIYNFLIFYKYNDYLKFDLNFKDVLNKINNGNELKGSLFWTKKIKMEDKIILLKTISKFSKKSRLFSMVLNKKENFIKYENDIQSEKILNQSIAILCDYICNKLRIKDSNLFLLIDEQIRKYNIEEYLNSNKIDFLSLKRLRNKNINFKINDKVKSHECSGVMFTDIIANGVQRIKNKNSTWIEKIIEENTLLKINYFIWPWKDYFNIIEEKRNKEIKDVEENLKKLDDLIFIE